jgi:hypothetical protein
MADQYNQSSEKLDTIQAYDDDGEKERCAMAATLTSLAKYIYGDFHISEEDDAVAELDFEKIQNQLQEETEEKENGGSVLKGR